MDGQELIIKTLNKIELLNEYRKEKKMNFYIEADGGINLDTVSSVKMAGADIIVSGTAIINSKNYKEIINKLKK